MCFARGQLVETRWAEETELCDFCASVFHAVPRRTRSRASAESTNRSASFSSHVCARSLSSLFVDLTLLAVRTNGIVSTP